MKIAKGILGIKAQLEANNRGWHVTLDGDYIGYFDIPMKTAIQNVTSNGHTLIATTGNGLSFASDITKYNHTRGLGWQPNH